MSEKEKFDVRGAADSPASELKSFSRAEAAERDLRELIEAELFSSPTTRIATTEAAEAEIAHQINIEDLRLTQDNRALRKKIAYWVGLGLGLEILFLFLLVLLQGLGRLPFGERMPFQLEAWTFDIFTTAVLLQTFGLARLVVKNLFPESERTSGNTPN